MSATVLGAVLPMVVTGLLGFVAAWQHDFGPKDAPILNRMALVYAVPLALFAGTVTTSRAQLSQGIALVIALCVAIIGMYGAVLLFCRGFLRLPMNISALGALAAAAPAVPFVGPAILGDLFGSSSAIPIAIASLVINLTVVPVTILLLTLNAAVGGSQKTRPASQVSAFKTKLVDTVREPIVWAPILGYRNPIINKAVLTAAISCMPIVIMFALKYHIAESEAASAVLLSIIGSVITLGIFLVVTS
jgi:malonate transporter